MHLHIMLQTLKEKCLYAKFSKCEFWLSNIVFLGHVVTSVGIMVDPKKVEADTQWLRPTTMTKIRSFLGMARYYRHFIQDFFWIATPLTNLTRKNIRF